MKIITNLHRIVFLGLIAALFTGCAGMQSMSSYARTGDTVSVALGGTEDSNALIEVLKKENISITITDASANSYPVTLKKLFRVYPDNSSEYIFDSGKNGGGLTMSAYTPPLIGQWIAIIDLVDPVTGSLPTLAVGQASLSVSAVGEIDQSVLYSGNNFSWENGNLGAVQIEVIAGQGTPNTLNYVGPMNYDPVAAIEPLPQILVSPSAVPVINFAGGSFSFVYTQADFASNVKVVPANHDPNIQLTSTSSDLGNGTMQVDVTLLNPKGFLTTNRSTSIGIGGSSPFRSARFNLIWKQSVGSNISTVDDQNWQNSIQMVSGQYIDMAGNVVTGITPVMKKTR